MINIIMNSKNKQDRLCHQSASLLTADALHTISKKSNRQNNPTALTGKNSKLCVTYPRFAVSKEHLRLM